MSNETDTAVGAPSGDDSADGPECPDQKKSLACDMSQFPITLQLTNRSVVLFVTLCVRPDVATSRSQAKIPTKRGVEPATSRLIRPALTPLDYQAC